MDNSTWISPEDRDSLRASAMRQRFLDRKSTILDPRKRKLGLDLNAIQQQIEEKKQREAREKAREDAFDHFTLEQQKLLLQRQEQERLARKQMAQEDDRVRMSQQRGEQSREFDIWRKDYKLIDHPMRQGDNDPNLGISAGQIFQGEDLQKNERLRQQALQREEWNKEQMREKQARMRQEEANNLRNQLIELETQKRLVQLEQQTEAANSQIRQQIAHDNLAMLEEKKRKEREDHEHEQTMNDAQLRENANTRTITEYMAGRNDAPQEYRGMTVEEQKRIIDEQSRQMEEKERLRQEEKQKEEEWNQYMEYLKAQGDLQEAQFLRKKQEEQRQLYQTHLEQEREFKERQKHMNNDVYGINIPSDHYYNQWGKEIR